MSNVTEIQAIMAKDFLTNQGLQGFFDVREPLWNVWSSSIQVDNLTTIDVATLTKSVRESCCLVLFLVRNW